MILTEVKQPNYKLRSSERFKFIWVEKFKSFSRVHWFSIGIVRKKENKYKEKGDLGRYLLSVFCK